MRLRFKSPTKLSPSSYKDGGEFLHAFRKCNGWTQSELAKFLGVSKILASMIEVDLKPVSTKMIRRIAKKTKHPIEVLFSPNAK